MRFTPLTLEIIEHWNFGLFGFEKRFSDWWLFKIDYSSYYEEAILEIELFGFMIL